MVKKVNDEFICEICGAKYPSSDVAEKCEEGHRAQTKDVEYM